MTLFGEILDFLIIFYIIRLSMVKIFLSFDKMLFQLMNLSFKKFMLFMFTFNFILLMVISFFPMDAFLF